MIKIVEIGNILLLFSCQNIEKITIRIKVNIILHTLHYTYYI